MKKTSLILFLLLLPLFGFGQNIYIGYSHGKEIIIVTDTSPRSWAKPQVLPGIHNTYIGYRIGQYCTGSYNFVIDTADVVLADTSSSVWRINPLAPYFKNNPECFVCLYRVFPHLIGKLPDDDMEALRIIEQARECLMLNIKK